MESISSNSSVPRPSPVFYQDQIEKYFDINKAQRRPPWCPTHTMMCRMNRIYQDQQACAAKRCADLAGQRLSLHYHVRNISPASGNVETRSVNNHLDACACTVQVGKRGETQSSRVAEAPAPSCFFCSCSNMLLSHENKQTTGVRSVPESVDCP